MGDDGIVRARRRGNRLHVGKNVTLHKLTEARRQLLLAR